jgi:hypothetical protein
VTSDETRRVECEHAMWHVKRAREMECDNSRLIDTNEAIRYTSTPGKRRGPFVMGARKTREGKVRDGSKKDKRREGGMEEVSGW